MGKIKCFFKYVPSFLLGAALCAGAFVYAYELKVVGIVNGVKIRQYDISMRLDARKGNAVKQTAKDMVFFTEMEKLGISVTDDEVEAALKREAEKYGGIAEMEKIMLDTPNNIDTYRLSIKKAILQQKAIDSFAQKAKGTDEEKAEKGREEYQSVIDKLEETTEIAVF